MPHLTLEYSNNLPAPFDHRALFGQLHAALERLGSFSPAQLKSRAVPLDFHYSAAGNPEHILIHLTVAVLDGRETSSLQQINAELLAILGRTFTYAGIDRPCDITVEIREMQRALYTKLANGATSTIPASTTAAGSSRP